MVAFVPVLHALLVTFKEAANYRGPKTAALYSKLAILMAVTWSAYPIIWAIGEGSQVLRGLNPDPLDFDACCFIKSAQPAVSLTQFVLLFISHLAPSP
jgi:hypothetical protein